ncbi:MAG: 50S ribosomal protein L21 [Rhodothermales bacterium]
MYAIVEIAGKQYKVHEKDKLVVPRLSGDVDDTVTFDRVLLVANGDEDIQLGTPVVEDASVTATIVEHVKGDKILVFRKKRRKRFKVKRGHRQPYTKIEVSGLSVEKPESKPSKKSTSTSKSSDPEKTADDQVEAAAADTPDEKPKAKASAKANKSASPEKASDKKDEASS